MKIYSFHFNKPEFIKLQLDSFQKFLKEEFELIIVNNGIKDFYKKNEKISKDLGLKCINITKPNHKKPGYSHQKALVYTWSNYVLKNPELTLFIDFDIFLYKKFSIKEYLEDNILAGLWQSRGHVKYFWPGLMIFDLQKIPEPEKIDLRGMNIDGYDTDSGGGLYYYLVKYPDIKIKSISIEYIIDQKSSLLPEFAQKDYKPEFMFQLLADHSFLHFGRGSNWDHMDKQYTIEKNNYLRFLMGKHLSD